MYIFRLWRETQFFVFIDKRIFVDNEDAVEVAKMVTSFDQGHHKLQVHINSAACSQDSLGLEPAPNAVPILSMPSPMTSWSPHLLHLHLQVLAWLAPWNSHSLCPIQLQCQLAYQGISSMASLWDTPTTAQISLPRWPQHGLALGLPIACAHSSSSSNWHTTECPIAHALSSFKFSQPAKDTWYMQCRKGTLWPKAIIQDGESLLFSLIYRNKHRKLVKLKRQRNIFLTKQWDKSQ